MDSAKADVARANQKLEEAKADLENAKRVVDAQFQAAMAAVTNAQNNLNSVAK